MPHPDFPIESHQRREAERQTRQTARKLDALIDVLAGFEPTTIYDQTGSSSARWPKRTGRDFSIGFPFRRLDAGTVPADTLKQFYLRSHLLRSLRVTEFVFRGKLEGIPWDIGGQFGRRPHACEMQTPSINLGHRLFAGFLRATAFAGLLAGIILAPQRAPGEEEWTKKENPYFSFSLPPSFEKKAARGTDSFVEKYFSDRMELSFDYGQYSNNFTGWPANTKYEALEIDGRSANLGRVAHEFLPGYPHAAQIHVKLDGKASLSVLVVCKSEAELAVARKIFESIRFKTKQPDR